VEKFMCTYDRRCRKAGKWWL